MHVTFGVTALRSRGGDDMCTSPTRLLWNLVETRFLTKEHADLQSCCEDHCVNMFFFSFFSQSPYRGVEICSAGKFYLLLATIP